MEAQSPQRVDEDGFVWKKSDDGIFSVRSCYSFLSLNMPAMVHPNPIVAALKYMWEIEVPSNISMFGWR